MRSKYFFIDVLLKIKTNKKLYQLHKRDCGENWLPLSCKNLIDSPSKNLLKENFLDMSSSTITARACCSTSGANKLGVRPKWENHSA